MPTFMVERYVPALTAEGLRALIDRDRAALAGLADLGVRHLRSTYLREDELCFSLLEAPSPEAVREASRLAGMPFERITEAIDLSVDGG